MNASAARMRLAAIAPMASRELCLAISEPRRKAPAQKMNTGRVATLELFDILLPWNLETFRRDALAMLQDESIEEVILRVDSPGGLVEGTPETAAVVRRLAAKKKVTTVATGYCCSAAFWIASQSSEIVASPSCLVGSCGVLSVLFDTSKMMESMGITVVPVSSADTKQIGLEGVPVSEEHIEEIKRLIHETERAFVLSLKNRRQMSDEQRLAAMHAHTYHAEEAMSHGFVDRVELTEDTIAAIKSKFGPTFGNLHGEEASAKYDELICTAAKVDDIDDASDRVVANVAKKFPQLSIAAIEHQSRQNRAMNWRP